MGYSFMKSNSFGADNWCLNLQALYRYSLLTSLSNGEVHQLDWQTCDSIAYVKTGDAPVNKLTVINQDYENGCTYATATAESVKMWDIRSSNNNHGLATISNKKKAAFISLDSRDNMLACGTELSGSDAELYLYDIRRYDAPLRSFVDSHHDDITDIAFHPSDPNVLMSGSTDGYTNVYDLRQVEEEDALHQVINFASIHSCGWLTPRTIFTLSHMETFAVHELNDKSEEAKEHPSLEFRDVRKSWECDYVVDIYPGYIACGNSQNGTGRLRILPFQGDLVEVDTKKSIDIKSAHGDEVVRDVLVPPHNSELLYSCGEDGSIKLWKNDSDSLNVPEQFWDYSQQLNVLDVRSAIRDWPRKIKRKQSKPIKSRKQRFQPY